MGLRGWFVVIGMVSLPGAGFAETGRASDKMMISSYPFVTRALPTPGEWPLPKSPPQIQTGKRRFALANYTVFRELDQQWEPVADFSRPNTRLLLLYRPHVVKRYLFDKEKESISDVLEGVESGISTATLSGNKIWVGFAFYEGEFRDGIGGIGFYNVATNEVGVLRHPALVDCSVTSVAVSSEFIYAVTRAYHEYSEGVCSGVVSIDRNTLGAKSHLPKDGRAVSVEQVQREHKDFVVQDAPTWPAGERESILKMGLEKYMVREAKKELALGKQSPKGHAEPEREGHRRAH